MPTPASWLELLERRLDPQVEAVQTYSDYYDGRHKLRFVTAKWWEAFGAMFGSGIADNWCQIVVDAAVERLVVEGFRFGGQDADTDAWAIWQANNLDADAKMAHREAVKTGRAYALVAPPQSDGDAPLITVEHPAQMTVMHAAGNRRERVAALKRWVDDDGFVYATVYLPTEIIKWQSVETVDKMRSPMIQWRRRPGNPGGANPFRVVPVVPIYNRPSMLGGGQSDLDPAIPLQDAIDKTLADMLVASEFGAFPQRVLTGIEIPKDPATGRPARGYELEASMSRLWTFGNENVKATEFSAADLSNYVSPLEMMIHHLAAQTRTPPHYLLGSMINASGDALKAAEAGLVSKVRDKQVDFSDSWEEVMRLAFSITGKADRARATDAETIWADPERRTDAEITDAAVKKMALGVPLEVLWEDLGYTPQQIDRMKTLPPPPAAIVPSPPGDTTAQSAQSSSDAQANGATS